MSTFDFVVADHGSICIVTPLSEAANAWVDDCITDDETQWFAGGFVVEPRYLLAVIDGIVNDGLTVG